jgi:ATP-dependent protease ClpP protease subunit
MARSKLTDIEFVHNYDIQPSKRLIYLHSQEYDDAGGENGVDYKMEMRFLKNIDYLNSLNSDPITVTLSSCGGDYYFGMGIYDAIMSSPAPVDIYAYGQAMSMGSIIFQAGAHRYISKNCVLMIHYGTYNVEGEARTMKQTLDFYESFNEVMFDIFSTKALNSQFAKDKKITSKDKMIKVLENQLKETPDWYLSSEQCIYYGFADSIF